jgi:hypothetical protein
MRMNPTPILLFRVLGGLLVLAAGAIHLWLYFDYFHRVHVIGALFVVNAAVAAVIGLMLLVSANQWVLTSGIAFAGGTLGAFFFTVYHGMFGYVERLTGPWQWAAGLVEAAAILVLLVALGLRRLATRARSQTKGFTPSYQRAVPGRIQEGRPR